MITQGFGFGIFAFITSGMGVSLVVEIVEAIYTFIAKTRVFDFMARTR